VDNEIKPYWTNERKGGDTFPYALDSFSSRVFHNHIFFLPLLSNSGHTKENKKSIDFKKAMRYR
jgi:hypothetical protein